MAKVPNAVEILPKISTPGRTSVTDRRQTDRRQTDGRQHIANVTSRSLKIDGTNIIVLRKDLFDVSGVLSARCVRDDIIIHWCLTPARPSAVLAADQISNKNNVCCCSNRPFAASIFPSFHNRCCQFIQQPLHTSSAPHLKLKFPQQSLKAKSGLLTFTSWHHFVINLMNTELTDASRTKQH